MTLHASLARSHAAKVLNTDARALVASCPSIFGCSALLYTVASHCTSVSSPAVPSTSSWPSAWARKTQLQQHSFSSGMALLQIQPEQHDWTGVGR